MFDTLFDYPSVCHLNLILDKPRSLSEFWQITIVTYDKLKIILPKHNNGQAPYIYIDTNIVYNPIFI